MPGIWYQMGLHCRTVSDDCPFDVSGFTFSGLPGVVIGHNRDIAWGMTNLDPDVSDLYLEKVTGKTYLYGGRQLPLAERDEVIRIAGSSSKLITVRSTRHGPVLSDVSAELSSVGANAKVSPDSPDRGNGYAVALVLDRAHPPTDGRCALRVRRRDELDRVPRGRAVVRRTQPEPRVRRPRGQHRLPGSWRGADPEGQPRRQLPGGGLAAAERLVGQLRAVRLAAQRAQPGRGVHRDREPGSRPDRTTAGTSRTRPTRATAASGSATCSTAAIGEGKRLDVSDMAAMQVDTRNPIAPVLVPYLMRQLMTSGYYAEGQRLLLDWDYTQPADSAAAAYFNVVWSNVLRLTFDDQLPESLWPDGGDRWMAVVSNLLRQPESQWWDDADTDGVVEDRDQILAEAMRDARDELTRKISVSPTKWTWGHLHQLDLENQSLGQSGIAAVRAIFNRGPYDVGGGTSIVDATSWDASVGYGVTSAPSMRMVVDLDDLERSRWINLTGESGHVTSGHYRDQTPLWLDGNSLPWAFDREAVTKATEHRWCSSRPNPTDPGSVVQERASRNHVVTGFRQAQPAGVAVPFRRTERVPRSVVEERAPAASRNHGSGLRSQAHQSRRRRMPCSVATALTGRSWGSWGTGVEDLLGVQQDAHEGAGSTRARTRS